MVVESEGGSWKCGLEWVGNNDRYEDKKLERGTENGIRQVGVFPIWNIVASWDEIHVVVHGASFYTPG